VAGTGRCGPAAPIPGMVGGKQRRSRRMAADWLVASGPTALINALPLIEDGNEAVGPQATLAAGRLARWAGTQKGG
jgi:hypothetical protein